MKLLTRPRRPAIRIDAVRQALILFNVNAGLRLWYDSIAGVTGFIFVGYALALGGRSARPSGMTPPARGCAMPSPAWVLP